MLRIVHTSPAVGPPTELTAPEKQLLAGVRSGAIVDLLPHGVNPPDPQSGHTWNSEQTIRAEKLTQILTMPSTPASPPVALRLRYAAITGSLNLDGADINCPVELENCYFEQAVGMEDSTVPTVTLKHCSLRSIRANHIETRGNFALDESVCSSVHLRGGRIGGDVSVNGATLSNPEARPFDAEGVQIAGNLYGHGLRTEGEVRLTGANIHGRISLNGAQLSRPVEDPTDTKSALNIDRAHIGTDIFATGGFKADGELRLLGTHVGGGIQLNGARIANQVGDALSTDGARIAGDVFLEHIQVRGRLHLPGTHIAGQVHISGELLGGEDGVSVLANRARIDEDLFFKGLVTDGTLLFHGVRVAGMLDLSALTVQAEGLALELRQGDISHLVLPTWPPTATIDLRSCRVRCLEDKWPDTRSVLKMDGLVYDTLTPLADDASARIDWIENSADSFLPQPYEQLASLLRRSGRDDDARRVAIAKERRRRSELRISGKVSNWFLGVTVGYGYKPGQGVWWLALLVAADCGIFAWAKALHRFHVIGERAQQVPQFHLAVFSLDHVLPLIELGQRSYWSAAGVFQYWQTFSDVAGWVLVTVILGAVTSRLVRD
jgi:cytoskeletal protein CcmA (bactofilin family)